MILNDIEKLKFEFGTFWRVRLDGYVEILADHVKNTSYERLWYIDALTEENETKHNIFYLLTKVHCKTKLKKTTKINLFLTDLQSFRPLYRLRKTNRQTYTHTHTQAQNIFLNLLKPVWYESTYCYILNFTDHTGNRLTDIKSILKCL